MGGNPTVVYQDTHVKYMVVMEMSRMTHAKDDGKRKSVYTVGRM